MAWRLAKSLETLRNQINGAYPNRSRVSDGTIGDAAHAASASDHNPNINGVVCAIDITHDPANGFDAGAFAEHIRTHRHPNLRYVIFNQRIAGYWNNWQWEASSGHTQHVHVSVGTLNIGDGQTYDRYDNTEQWDINLGGDDMIEDKDNEYWRWNKLGMQIRGRSLTRAEFRKSAVGKSWLRAMEILSDDKEANTATQMQDVGRLALKDKWQQQIYDLQDGLKKSNAALDSAKKQGATNTTELERQKKLNSELIAKYAAQDLQYQEAQKTGAAFMLWLGDTISKFNPFK
jgi:hypothetical protein